MNEGPLQIHLGYIIIISDYNQIPFSLCKFNSHQ